MTAVFGDPRLPQRFWDKVVVNEQTECWEWTAGTNERGYGVFGTMMDGRWRNMKAHRLAHIVMNGPIQGRLLVDHKCLKRSCVNPSHLRAVTAKQNQENLAHAKLRSTSGVRGVSWASRNKKWLAKVTHHQKQVYVGLYDTITEAETAVIAKRIELFTHNELDRLAS